MNMDDGENEMGKDSSDEEAMEKATCWEEKAEILGLEQQRLVPGDQGERGGREERI